MRCRWGSNQPVLRQDGSRRSLGADHVQTALVLSGVQTASAGWVGHSHADLGVPSSGPQVGSQEGPASRGGGGEGLDGGRLRVELMVWAPR
jgi:hypothetical protein